MAKQIKHGGVLPLPPYWLYK